MAHEQRTTQEKGLGRLAWSCVAVCLFTMCSLPGSAVAAAHSPTPAQPLPISDPQFWIVTAAALGAGGWLVWRLLPASVFLKRRKTRSTRTTLTIDGKSVNTKPKRECH